MYEGYNQDKPMVVNFRPPQALNGRKVKSIEVDKSFIYISPSKWDYESTDIGMYPKFVPSPLTSAKDGSLYRHAFINKYYQSVCFRTFL